MKKRYISIPTLTFIVLTSLTISLLTVFSLLWYNSSRHYLKLEFADNKQELLKNTQKVLIELVNTGINIIDVGREDFNNYTRRELKSETIQFKDTCMQLIRNTTDRAKQQEQIIFIMNVLANSTDPKRSVPFPFIIIPESGSVIFPTNVFTNILSNMENTNSFNKDMAGKIAAVISNTQKTRRGYYFNSIFEQYDIPGQLIRNKCFTLYIPQLDIIVGSSFYDKHIEEAARNEIFSYISKLGIANDEYVFVIDNKGIMLSYPDERMIGRNLIAIRDPTGLELTKSIFKIAHTNPEGGFLEYSWWRNNTKTPFHKMGFSKEIPDIGWIISSAIFTADFNHILETKKLRLEDSMHANLKQALFLLLLIILLELIISLTIYRKTKSYISRFTSSLRKTIDRRSLLPTGQFKLLEFEEIYKNTNTMLLDLLNAENELKEFTAKLEEKVAQRTQELQTKTIQLEESTRAANSANRAKSDFLANMSHEIRTPMNIILGMQQILLDSEMSYTQHNYLTKANQAAISLLNIINDILDFSKIEAGKMQIERVEFDIEKTVNETLSFLNFEAVKKGIEIILDYDLTIPEAVNGDPLRLRQILSNITNNAIKFSNDGVVLITVRNMRTEDGQIYINFKVQDNGIGISYEEQKELFTPFKQADNTITRKFGGTGLGLVICKQLIELQGGSINFHSTPTKGATFNFTLPFILLVGIGPRNYLSPDTPPKERIMIIDQNRLSLSILQRYCLANQYQADIATSLSEACLLLENSKEKDPAYHTIMINSVISNAYGAETMLYLNAHYSLTDTRFILMINRITPETIKSAKDIGFDQTIHKPISPGTLRQVLEATHETTSTSSRLLLSNNIDTRKFKDASILVAEDNEINQEVIFTMLKRIGCNVILTKNGETAIQLSQKHRFDLILMDIQMPILDGLSATRKIREFDSSTPIIAMTAHAMKEDFDKSIQAGMNAHITKPIQLEKLYTTLNTFISSRSNNPYPAAETPEIPPTEQSHITTSDGDSYSDTIWKQLLQVNQVNLCDALGNIGGDKKLLISLYRNYLKTAPKTRQELKNALAAGDLDTVFNICHTLKGTCGTIGENTIQAITRNIVERLRKNRQVDITADTEELLIELGEFIAALKNIFQGQQDRPENNYPS